MTRACIRSAVAPLHRVAGARGHGVLPSVDEVVAAERPWEPLHCLRPDALRDGAAAFAAAFPGDVLYAVKCNPEPALMRALHAGGIRHFDVASPSEMQLVRRLFPMASLHYSHPVKPRQAIRVAYERHGCRSFVIDYLHELLKIGDETGGASDLTVLVRLALPKAGAHHDLGGKFGASPGDAVELLRAARRLAAHVGLCFHVGSQCMDPGAYGAALELADQVVARAGVPVDVIDVGGGFPVAYPGLEPPSLDALIAAVVGGFERMTLPPDCHLWCEPGRALAAPGVSLVVQVILRRGTALYINDGIYGSLSDAGRLGMRYPARLIRPGPCAAEMLPFSFFGPSCDSADRMPGPFLLPADVREGDWIELGQLGAYGGCLRSAFNGFDQAHLVEVRDPPLTEVSAHSTAGLRRCS